mmetsp:Transcript_113096/g.326769  ORF Transcript_113096/g.326769 Transcript_113096/m.326769 type:complete len:217 (-) Transcript_113096:241-891(-)
MRALRDVRGDTAQAPFPRRQIRTDLAHGAVPEREGQLVVHGRRRVPDAAEVRVGDARVATWHPCALCPCVHCRVVHLVEGLAAELAALHARDHLLRIRRVETRRRQCARARLAGLAAGAVAEEVAMRRVPEPHAMRLRMPRQGGAKAAVGARHDAQLRRGDRRVRRVNHRRRLRPLFGQHGVRRRIAEVLSVDRLLFVEAVLRSGVGDPGRHARNP